MPNIPDNVPAELRDGDTWNWTRSLPDYPATAGWTLKYRFKNAAGGFEVVAGSAGADYAITVAAATTAGYTAGKYTWQGWVENASLEKYTIDSGSITLLPDYRAAAASVALDDRSHARKMLDAIEAWLESKDPGVAEYEIAGRRMKYIPSGELIKLRSQYKMEVAGEANALALARGEGFGRKIQFRI